MRVVWIASDMEEKLRILVDVGRMTDFEKGFVVRHDPLYPVEVGPRNRERVAVEPHDLIKRHII